MLGFHVPQTEFLQREWNERRWNEGLRHSAVGGVMYTVQCGEAYAEECGSEGADFPTLYNILQRGGWTVYHTRTRWIVWAHFLPAVTSVGAQLVYRWVPASAWYTDLQNCTPAATPPQGAQCGHNSNRQYHSPSRARSAVATIPCPACLPAKWRAALGQVPRAVAPGKGVGSTVGSRRRDCM